MGLFDALFGRSKPVVAKTEKLFAITTAAVKLETRWGLRPSGSGAVVFRPLSSSYFAETEQELKDLLSHSARKSSNQPSASSGTSLAINGWWSTIQTLKTWSPPSIW